jgi:hypothetical protein
MAEDPMEHIHLENNILFPRFAAVEDRAQERTAKVAACALSG